MVVIEGRCGRRVDLLVFSLLFSFGLGFRLRVSSLWNTCSVRGGYRLSIILSYFSLFNNTS